ncbi:hypothetical protein [Azospirillum melinis]
MHPYSRQEDQVEAILPTMKLPEIRKMVIDPFDGFFTMETQSLLSKRIGRLYSNDSMAEQGKRGGVAT